MTPLGVLIRDEILRGGPMPFRRFMELALYHPEYGYYRRARDPFGKEGDFYTAEQVQPVFGVLVAARIRGSCSSPRLSRTIPTLNEFAYTNRVSAHRASPISKPGNTGGLPPAGVLISGAPGGGRRDFRSFMSYPGTVRPSSRRGR